MPAIHYRPDPPTVTISNDRSILSARSAAEPKIKTVTWRVWIHVNSTPSTPTRRTDNGLILIYSLETKNELKTEHVRQGVEKSDEVEAYRACIRKEKCRLVLDVSTRNIVGTSDSSMLDILPFGFIEECCREKRERFVRTHVGIYYKTNF